MKYALILCSAAFVLSGCSSMYGSASPVSGPRPLAIEGNSISYETTACYGRCPIYRLTVRPDGSGVFEGQNYTAVTGERRFTITPAQYRAFETHLAPLRPAQGEVVLDGTDCRMMISDQPGAAVTWTRAIGDMQAYRLNYGCDRTAYGAAMQRLRAAPALLPIQAFIGARP